MSLATRTPTGAVPYPLILVEGEEKAGKSWAAAQLTASQKVGDSYWIDLGEGSADEYGAIPGTRYQIVEHGGDWHRILDAVTEITKIAQAALDADKPPVVLVIDSMTAEWDLLKDWANDRARGQKANRAKLAADPNAEVTISMNLWNDAGSRHRRLMMLLFRFPGIVVVTARGGEVAAVEAGKPVEGKKTYRVEGQKNLAFDASFWLRMFRTDKPLVVGCRSVHVGIKPGKDDPLRIDKDVDNLLEWVVFDALKVDAKTSHVRNIDTLTAGDLTDDERAEDPEAAQTDSVWVKSWSSKVGKATTKDQLGPLWQEMVEKHKAKQLTDAHRTVLEQNFQVVAQRIHASDVPEQSAGGQ